VCAFVWEHVNACVRARVCLCVCVCARAHAHVYPAVLRPYGSTHGRQDCEALSVIGRPSAAPTSVPISNLPWSSSTHKAVRTRLMCSFSRLMKSSTSAPRLRMKSAWYWVVGSHGSKACAGAQCTCRHACVTVCACLLVRVHARLC